MEWINIKDRLPDIGHDVIVCDFSGQICKGRRRIEPYQGSEWSLQCGTISIAAETNHILYWQPIPDFIKSVEIEHRLVMEKVTKKRCRKRHIIMPNCGDCEYLEKWEG